MDSDRKIFYVPALCFIMLALVTTSTAAVLAGCRSTEPARIRVDDATITRTIKAKLATDGETNPFSIDVITNEGVVTLQGRVKNQDAREKVERHARETDGVQRVINLVKVGDPQ
jgi:osmotically-inducible protein OsmY